MNKAIYFDMDGTIASLYGVQGWLDMLIAEDPTPYAIAEPLVNMSSLARLLHKAQRNGYHIGVISWLSKSGSEHYNQMVTDTKMAWLRKHLPSVIWDEIKIVPYGTPKSKVADRPNAAYLFDDEDRNQMEWNNVGESFYPDMLLEVLRELC